MKLTQDRQKLIEYQLILQMGRQFENLYKDQLYQLGQF
ncbi:hypothetical protein AB97_5656 [Escherichia coli 1-110-08_S3_C1]|nr:hypothetical protein AD37_5416 [Escherichia coli 1-110-08_S4_C3]EYE09288.1 hypothetical protein AC80_5500 [Escherichia coli 1-110-08_S4_C1]EYE13114.1 hypothetical protein AB97_5656 [Escherichia coli 1-110-08_S3_C1]